MYIIYIMSSPTYEIKLNQLDCILTSIKHYCQTISQQKKQQQSKVERKVFNGIIDDCISVSRDFFIAFSSASYGIDHEIQLTPHHDRPSASISREKSFLSLQQIRLVYTAIEVLWYLVLMPFISANTGFQLPEANLAKSIMLSSDNLVQIAAVTSGDNSDCDGEIYLKVRAMRCLHVVADIAMNDMFAGHMLDRNLNRILLCALTIEHTAAVDSSNVNSSNIKYLHTYIYTYLQTDHIYILARHTY